MMKNSASKIGLLALALTVASVGFAQEKKKEKKPTKAPATTAAPAAPASATDGSAASSSSAPSPASNTAKSSAQSSAGGKVSYGMSGCGLGTMVMKQDTMFDQILGLTTNSTSGSQLFGITTGTSGCEGSGPSKSAALRLEEQRVFVTNNMSTLEREIAQGGGETVASLAFVSGCSDEALPTFGKLAQGSHSELFSSENAQNVVEVLNAKIRSSETLQKYCL